ncbi:MAG: type I restriction endonuclease subunit R [Chitinophagales bacterium]|nr:type I restriction endonuclease subunit R [Chitinophagales bacterium]
MTQSEQILEDNLVKQLATLGYEFVSIKDEADLLANLKTQLEKHNEVKLSDKEFFRVLNHLNKGNIFDRAETLRDRYQLTKDNGDICYIEFLNQEHWCQNLYQVTQQVSIEGKYKNRYDVTLLINGLPLVQIELKRRGLEIKEAFNQINRYQRHSFWASSGLFQYVQIFVISNGVNTKYYANNRRQSFKQTFYWTDKGNKKITQLEAFAEAFLEKCHLSKMICKYIVLHQSDRILMVLRPYQYYAVEAIIDQVKNSTKNGYIWHTTGSGKTLTSFKASQILVNLPHVDKVVFVVDRNDLDYQTTKEFNYFSEGSVDGTDNTKVLVDQFAGTFKDKKGNPKQTKLIITTIQKLNNAISRQRYLKRMEPLKDKRIVFIFDECHRSQFGDTHKRIKSFFTNHQMFGFTGTPIFAENAVKNQLGKRITRELFDKRLHEYVITNAIRDENVLRFSIEYVGKYKQKEDSQTYVDIDVEGIDTKELLESEKRLSKIVDYIIANHSRKTYRKDFSAIFCVSSVETLIKYYEIFKTKKEKGAHDLRVVTIFSYRPNEEDKEADGLIEDEFASMMSMAAEPQPNYSKYSHTREKLDDFIADYNTMYQTNFSTRDSQSFYNYYKDISKRFKDRERTGFQDKNRADILLVVNMFLTGFDAKKVNTLYVDKNLKYHGLIQAFSRTNRIINEVKSYGNIICFRNLKEATDDAIALFSNPDAKEVILMQPYEVYVRKFDEALEKLKQITPTIDSVNELPSEDEELEFIKAFRGLMRLKNILSGFSDFEFEDLEMEEQEFEDYKSKYLDIHDKVKNRTVKEKVSILDDVDFELELIHRDEINVSYILVLLSKLVDAEDKEKEKQRKIIIDLLGGEVQLRSKKELIEKFINENLPDIQDGEDISIEFLEFWNKEKLSALNSLCEKEKLSKDKLFKIIDNYLFTGRKPLRDNIVGAMEVKPKLLQRKTIAERVIDKIINFVQTFDEGMGDV